MDFVHEVDFSIVLTEFILGIYQNQATFCSHLCSAFEQCQSVFFQRFVFFRSSESLSQDFFFGDILIVHTHFGFGSRSDNGVRELFVFTHTFGQTDTADFANAAFISTPCTSAEVSANNHFYRESLAHYADSNHRVGSSQFPVRTNVSSCVQKFGCDLVQHLSFVWNSFRQNNVECRDTVGSNHY